MDTKNWKYFTIRDLFNVELTKGDIKADRIDYGSIPLVSSGESNNGIVKYIEEEGDGKAEIFSAGNLTIDMFCHAYFQPNEFYAVGHGRVNILQPKFKINSYIGIFLCSLINMELYRFSYGRAVYSNVAKLITIKLPIDKNGNPDWQWIEDYVKKNLVPKLPDKSKSVWEKEFDTKPLTNNKLQLNTKEWKWFKYTKLFNIKGSITTPKIELEESGFGLWPYVTTQAINNGIEGFYNIKTEKGNILTVDSAVLGYCAYQENDFSASDHVEELIPKFHLTPYIAMFLTTIINKEQYRYNYGRKCSQAKLKKSQIKLPAILNAQGEYEPDWQWMEDYIKGLPYSGCL